jgi:hypothetical protein
MTTGFHELQRRNALEVILVNVSVIATKGRSDKEIRQIKRINKRHSLSSHLLRHQDPCISSADAWRNRHLATKVRRTLWHKDMTTCLSILACDAVKKPSSNRTARFCSRWYRTNKSHNIFSAAFKSSRCAAFTCSIKDSMMNKYV